VSIEEALDPTAADDPLESEWDWSNQHSATFENRLKAARAYHKKVKYC